MRLIKILASLLLSLSLSVSAQQHLKNQSYVVTRTNDTIYGKIKTNLLYGGSKLVATDSAYALDAGRFIAYYNAKQRAIYHSKVLPTLLPEKLTRKLGIHGKAEWLKCVEDGDIKIYEVNTRLYGYQLDNFLNLTATMGLIVASGGIPNFEFSNWYIEKTGQPQGLTNKGGWVRCRV